VCTTVAVNSSLTLKAIAVETGYNNSAVATGAYTIMLPAATPTFNPAPGSYNSSQNVTISDATAGAVIHCTTDGSTPTANSPVCTTVPVSSSLTLQAIAVATGYNNSAVATGIYSITPTAAAPTFSLTPGNYSAGLTVALSDSTPGAVIHCTLNGLTPTASSHLCSSVVIDATRTLKALAIAPGYNNSAVNTGVYTITLPAAATPTMSPKPGSYSFTQSVVLSDTTPHAVLHYTTDGSTPTASSTVYRKPLQVNQSQTIRAIAVARGYSESEVATGAYTIGGGFKGRHHNADDTGPDDQR
jgi:stage V sporulation protein SpoVS